MGSDKSKKGSTLVQKMTKSSLFIALRKKRSIILVGKALHLLRKNWYRSPRMTSQRKEGQAVQMMTENHLLLIMLKRKSSIVLAKKAPHLLKRSVLIGHVKETQDIKINQSHHWLENPFQETQ